MAYQNAPNDRRRPASLNGERVVVVKTIVYCRRTITEVLYYFPYIRIISGHFLKKKKIDERVFSFHNGRIYVRV